MLDSQVQKVLDEMAEIERQFDAQFAVDEATGLFLYELVLRYQPRRILELGTWRGASTVYMAAALKELGAGKITTVDVGNDRVELARQNFIKAGLESCIAQEVSDVSVFLNQDDNQYDMVFMDATKNEQGTWFKQLLQNNLGKNSIVVVDDAIKMGGRMKDLFELVKSHPGLTSEIEKVGDGLMVIQFDPNKAGL